MRQADRLSGLTASLARRLGLKGTEMARAQAENSPTATKPASPFQGNLARTKIRRLPFLMKYPGNIRVRPARPRGA